jgi:hypothetical protein
VTALAALQTHERPGLNRSARLPEMKSSADVKRALTTQEQSANARTEYRRRPVLLECAPHA